jgi:adenine-specific DNA-methyltransferase
VNTKKKYGLVWEDKLEDIEEELRTHLPVLKEVKEREWAIINDTETEKYPNHILIEGDNLHALTALTFTHENKIDLIYIDPPYNTGKENEFRYNDKWILKDDPFKHSMWLNFISKRLKVAKRLMSDDGVLICHIDENEFDALNLLLETEIFSDNDFLGVIIWNKLNPKGEVAGVATMHEYILIYAKDKEKFKLLDNILTRPKPNAVSILKKAKTLFNKIGKTQIPDSIKEVIKPFSYSKELLKDFEVVYDVELVNLEFQAWLSKQDFSGGEKAYKFIDKKGNVCRGVSMAAPDKPETRSHRPLMHPITNKPCPVPSKGWRNPDVTMDKLLKKGLIIFGEDENKQPEKKYLLKENLSEVTPSIYNNGSSDEKLMKDLNLNFPYPKVTSVAKYLINNIHPNPKIILDFFAGSGTTLHATMELNAEDSLNRTCIMVTNNENKIAEEVTFKRSKKIIDGYSTIKGEDVKGLSNNNLRYYKTDVVESIKSEYNRRLLTKASVELLNIKENCYDEKTTELDLKVAEVRIFTSNTMYLIIIFHSRNMQNSIEAVTKIINEIPEGKTIKLYGFSPEKETLREEFIEVANRIEAIPLPEAIYNAYRNTYRTIGLSK